MAELSTDEGDLRFSNDLRDRGFEGGEPVHEYYNCFTEEEAKASLFGSTYSKVIPVTMKDENSVSFSVILTRAEPRFVSHATLIDSSPAGCYEEPNWYFEGWIPRSGYDALDAPTRIRIYVNNGFDDTFLWQVIPTAPTDGLIKMVP